jgi:hypothetical protein
MSNPTNSRRILIVEDEPLIAMLVQEWLEELNCTAIGPAASVGGALKLIAGVALDGAVPFVFATGYGVDGLEARFAGALVLAKPFEHELFRDIVGKMLTDRPGA